MFKRCRFFPISSLRNGVFLPTTLNKFFMETIKVPAGHQVIMPYFMVQDAAGFLAFMQNVFGAQETVRAMRDENKLMHAEVKIGDSTIMFCDSTPEWKSQSAGLFVYVDDADEVYKKALVQGATSVMEPADKDYGRSAGVTDPFGNTWWITSLT